MSTFNYIAGRRGVIMDAVFDWVKSIVFYLILLTVITHLMPNKKYEKYIRFFTGMLLVMVVIKPVIQFFSWDEVFEKNYLEILGDGGQINWEDETLAGELQEVQEQKMVKEYERQVEMFAVSEAEKLGMQVSYFRVAVKQEEGLLVPESISMEVVPGKKEDQLDQIMIADIIIEEREKETTKNGEFKNLQKILAEYYGMEENQVQIVGR